MVNATVTTSRNGTIGYRKVQTTTVNPDPNGQSTLTQLMAGIGVTFSPEVLDPSLTTCSARIQIKFTCSNATATNGTIAQLRISNTVNQSSPANGIAISGTTLGFAQSFTSATANALGEINLEWIATGLTFGSWWVDFSFAALNGTTAVTLTNVQVIIEQI